MNIFHTPRGVFVDASHIYVADLGNSRLQVFDRATRAYQATLQDPGSGEGQFLYPTDVAVDAAGTSTWLTRATPACSSMTRPSSTCAPMALRACPISPMRSTSIARRELQSPLIIACYVVDSYGNRLLKLNPDGSLAWSVGEAGVPGNDAAHFNRPVDVALDAAGWAYVVDRNNHRVQIFDSSGAHQATLGAGLGSAAGQFQFPRGIAVAERWHNLCGRYRQPPGAGL